MKRIFLAVMLFAGGLTAQMSPSEITLVEQLLECYSPGHDWRQLPPERLKPIEFQKPDSPDEGLLKKWAYKQAGRRYRYTSNETEPLQVTPDIQINLLEGCKNHPEYLPDLLDFFPKEPATYDVVFSVFRKAEERGVYRLEDIRTFCRRFYNFCVAKNGCRRFQA